MRASPVSRGVGVAVTVGLLLALNWGCQSTPAKPPTPTTRYTLLVKADRVEIIPTADTRQPGTWVGEPVPVDRIAEVLTQKGVKRGEGVGVVVFSEAPYARLKAVEDQVRAWRENPVEGERPLANPPP